MLEAYAGPVLAREPLPRLIEGATVWLRSPQTLTLWLLPLLLWQLPAGWAALLALLIYVAWQGMAPGLVNRAVLLLFRQLERVSFQAIYYVVILSLFAERGDTAAVVIGLAGFIALRWQLLDRIVNPLVRRLWAVLFPLPVPDQVLRSLILRTALKYRLPIPEIDRMERQLLNLWNYKRTSPGNASE